MIIKSAWFKRIFVVVVMCATHIMLSIVMNVRLLDKCVSTF